MVKTKNNKKNKPSQPKLKKQITKPRRNKPKAKSRVAYAGDPCALHYSALLLDPFGTSGGACVPKFPTIKSAKRKYVAGGVGQCVAGNGGIIVRPNAAKDVDSIYYSTSAWVASAANALPLVSDTGVGHTHVNGELSDIDFGGTVGKAQSRLVALGVRVRSSGTVSNNGGLCFSLEEPDHIGLSGATVDTLRGYTDDVSKDEFNNVWTEVLYQPRFPDDFGYAANSYGQTSQVFFLAISIQSAYATQPFEWEVVSHWELIGPNVQGKTISHTSVAQADNIIAGLAQIPQPLKQLMANDPKMRMQVARRLPMGGPSIWERLASGLAGGAIRVGATMLGGALAGPYGAAAGNAIGQAGMLMIR